MWWVQNVSCNENVLELALDTKVAMILGPTSTYSDKSMLSVSKQFVSFCLCTFIPSVELYTQYKQYTVIYKATEIQIRW